MRDERVELSSCFRDMLGLLLWQVFYVRYSTQTLVNSQHEDGISMWIGHPHAIKLVIVGNKEHGASFIVFTHANYTGTILRLLVSTTRRE